MLVWVNVCKYEAFIVVSTNIPMELVLSTVEKSRRLNDYSFLSMKWSSSQAGRSINRIACVKIATPSNLFPHSLPRVWVRQRGDEEEDELFSCFSFLICMTFSWHSRSSSLGSVKRNRIDSNDMVTFRSLIFEILILFNQTIGNSCSLLNNNHDYYGGSLD